MIRRLAGGLFLIGLLLSLAAAQSEKTYRAERFDVTVEVQENGSLLVEETVTFDFVGGPFTFVFRELPLERTDGIRDIAAGMDGRTLPFGTNPGQVEVEEGKPVRVTWHLAPTVDAQHTFVLRYRVLGVVQKQAAADLLEWQPLPDEHEYAIGSSRTTISYPRDLEPLETPVVLSGEATVNVEHGVAQFSAQDLGLDETLVVRLRFPPGSLISEPPAWQARRQTHDQYAWIWVVAAIGVLGAGVVGLWTATRRFMHPDVRRTARTYDPPGDLPPAMAGILHDKGSGPQWQHALGTLFDLAERGLLAIEEIPAEKWYRSRDFVIRQMAQPANLRPHEEALLELLFREKGESRDEVRLSRLNKLISSSRWKGFSEQLKMEMKEAGLLNEARRRGQRRLTIGAVLLLVGSLAALVLLISVSGRWSLLVPASLFVLSIIWFVAASSVSTLTDEAAARAAEWEAFYRHLRAVARGNEAISSPEMFDESLPYAAAFGLLSSWVKRFEKTGWTHVPAYFHALRTADGSSMGAFAAMASASSSSGGAAAGAGGAAGAAGGGASGAG